MKKSIFSGIIILISNLFFCSISFAQLEPDEVAATPVPIGGVKTAYYDKCKGILYATLQTSQDAANTRPLYKAYVYIKVGTQWKNVMTLRGEDARCCNNTCGAGMDAGLNWNNTQRPLYNSVVDATNHNNVCAAATNVNNTSGTIEPGHVKRRIGYYNGAVNNFSWFSYEDELACETYNANLDVIGNAASIVSHPNPPEVNTGHPTGIGSNLLPISVYPTSVAWALQFGITNVPRAAIIGNNIQVRIYVNYRRYEAGWGSTAAADNWYETYEYAVSTQIPDAPLGLTASTNQCNQVTLNWSNPSQTWSGSLNCTSVQNYNNVIFRDGVKIAVVPGSAVSYTDNSATLQQRQTYNYSVKTILWNEGNLGFRESSSSNVATGSMKMPPAQPSPFTASDDKCNASIELTWSQPNGTAVNQYSFVTPVYSTTIASSARSYNWTNDVVRGTTYPIKLVALNDCNYPSDTAMVNGLSPADPAIATDVTAILNATSDTVTVSWTDNANNETKYQVIRQDNLGNQVTFDVNPNVTSYKDNGITSCRDYTYSVKVFNECVQSGFISASASTGIVPPPNLNTTFTPTKKLTCSKGYFSNRIELNWTNNNGQNIDLFKIYRKINGTTFDSTLVGTSAAGGGFYVDNTADARVYYKYTIIGIKYCNDTDILTNVSEDIGFRNPTGNVSGHIEYNGGIALTGAKVIIQQAGTATGTSLQFASGETLTTENPSTLGLSNQLRMEFWFKPTSYNATQNIVEKAGVFSFKHTGTNYIALVNVGGTDYTISVPQTNFPLNQWKHVSMQYLGDSTRFRLYANGLPIGNAVVPDGIISNVNNQVVIGGANSTFLMDEFRLMALAAPLDTTIYIDHARHLNASVPGSKISLRFDENFGDHAYDGSSQSNVFNGNHFIKTPGVTWSLDKPSSGQLSYYGITNSLGNYSVSGIAFSGSGENFTIIPSFLTHTFTPNSRSVFIGDASTVFNNQDFIDNSSFTVSGDLFYKNTTCPVPNGLLKIDGLPVISNGQEVKTGPDGNFTIQVPIGHHFISVDKFEHHMEEGRFPATGTYDFQADVAGINFIDSTRRSIVGRVVGGLLEANKAPGMGRSKNNLGKTKIRIVSPIAGIPCYAAEVITDSLTGEYRFDVPPLQYRIDSVYVLSEKLVLTSTITPSPFTNTNKLVDLRNSLVTTTVVDTLYDEFGGIVSIDSVKYNVRHDMIYRIRPTINVTDTLNNLFIGEDSLSHNGTTFSIKPTGPGWGPLGFPVFMQDKKYAAKIHASEIYTNFDNLAKDTVRLSGNVSITNAMVDGTDPNSSIKLKNGIAIYNFTCGSPNTSTNTLNPALDYTKSLQVSVVPSGAATVVWEPNTTITPPIYHAYVLGQRIAGTGIATLGPEKVDFILRDPPGSGSSSKWTTGTSVSLSKDYSRASSAETNVSVKLKMGTKKQVGIMVASEVEVDNSLALGLNTVGTNASGQGWTETMTSSYSVATRDDPGNVGAPADIFIGRSRNWLVGPTLNIELIDEALCPTVGGCFGPPVNGKRMARKAGYAIAPADVKTRFSYTQSEIETVVIPTLESLRATKLAGSLYTSNIPSTHPNFGSNNDDPIWGALATTATPEIYEPADASGPSYTYTGDIMADRDTVRSLNTQIALWKKALARNEREKIQCITNTGGILIDNFTLGSAVVTNSYTTDREAYSSETWELSIGGSVNIELGAVFGGIGAQFEESIAITETSGGEESRSTTNSTSFEYTLTDGDPGDIMSIDVYKSPEGTGNIFVTRGGYTMCPYEGEVVSHYYNPANPNGFIGSHTYNPAGYATIQLATVQREIPEISITPASQFSIPSDQPAVFQLLLTNQSPLVVNNDIDFAIRVASVSNPHGAVVKIDGLSPSTTYNIPAGTSVSKTLTVERGPIEINYDSLMIIFSSACSHEIADTAYISAHFIPTCTDLQLTSPNNNWVFNNSLRDTANIIVSNYNYNFGAATDNSTTPPTRLGLNKIGVEFRPISSNVWTEFQSFYKYPTTGQDTIPSNLVYSQYLWDIASMPDGAYELKTKSYCLNRDGSFAFKESPIHAGVIDRINPHPFGTPSPADGILDPNDDISIRFNEPIDIGSLTNLNFDVRGVINGGNSRQNESLNFDGIGAYAEVAAGTSLQKRNFTFEFWAQVNGAGVNQTVISQGTDATQNLAIGFDASNHFSFSMGPQTVASIAPVASINNWHHYAAVYDFAAQTASLYVDGTLVNSGNT
ncbi:MAG: LamG-like jellyroll fold domain-containing protein, partial [Cytophagaceae bacterium]